MKHPICTVRRKPLTSEWKRWLLVHANEPVAGLPQCSTLMLLNGRFMRSKDPDLGPGYQFISLDGPFPKAVTAGIKMQYTLHQPNDRDYCIARMHIPDWADE